MHNNDYFVISPLLACLVIGTIHQDLILTGTILSIPYCTVISTDTYYLASKLKLNTNLSLNSQQPSGTYYQTKSEKLVDPALPEHRWQFVYRVAAVSRGTLP